jgi:transcriptional regulator with XRE-family HTH domain
MSITKSTHSGINERIRAVTDWYAARCGVPLTGFANLVGIPYRSLQNYIRGERQPSANTVRKLVQLAGVDANWLVTGEGQQFRSEHLDKLIVDKLIVLLLNDILDRCYKQDASPLLDSEKRRLMSYMMSANHLGLGDAVRTLLEMGVLDQFEDIPDWVDAIKDMISPAPKKWASKRGRRKGP